MSNLWDESDREMCDRFEKENIEQSRRIRTLEEGKKIQSKLYTECQKGWKAALLETERLTSLLRKRCTVKEMEEFGL